MVIVRAVEQQGRDAGIAWRSTVSRHRHRERSEAIPSE
jgi:hypothetical protein